MTKRSKRGKTKRKVPATSRTGARPPAGAASISTLIVNGWTLLFWVEFRERWNALRDAAQEARTSDPVGYVHHPAVKLFRTVHDLVFEEIPADPDATRFRQGKTLGREHTHWRRAKFHRRFRLFFRFHSASRTIIFAWLNDENTLRKAGAATDVYSVFHRMLTRRTLQPTGTSWSPSAKGFEKNLDIAGQQEAADFDQGHGQAGVMETLEIFG